MKFTDWPVEGECQAMMRFGPDDFRCKNRATKRVTQDNGTTRHVCGTHYNKYQRDHGPA